MTDIVVIFACALLGYIVARIINKQSHNREMVYCHLMNFAVDMHNNVQHGKQTLGVFIASSNKEYKSTVQQLLENASTVGCRLSSIEEQELEDFVSGLSAHNSSSILHHLDRYIVIFDAQYNKMHSTNKQQYAVNSKVGILLGAVLALLLI